MKRTTLQLRYDKLRIAHFYDFNNARTFHITCITFSWYASRSMQLDSTEGLPSYSVSANAKPILHAIINT